MHLLSLLPKFVLDIKYITSFRYWSASKTKIRPNFALFDSCKMGG